MHVSLLVAFQAEIIAEEDASTIFLLQDGFVVASQNLLGKIKLPGSLGAVLQGGSLLNLQVHLKS